MLFSSTYVATNQAESYQIANAIKASGAIVRLEVADFREILLKSEKPLVVTSKGGVFWSYYRYLTHYKGFVFYARSRDPITIPQSAEVVNAGKIWIPA